MATTLSTTSPRWWASWRRKLTLICNALNKKEDRMLERGKSPTKEQKLEMRAQNAQLEGQLRAPMQGDAMTRSLAKEGNTGQELLQTTLRKA